MHPLMLRLVALEPVQQSPAQLAPVVQPVLLHVDPEPLQRPSCQQRMEVPQHLHPRTARLPLQVLQAKQEALNMTPLVLAAEEDVPAVHPGAMGIASHVPVGIQPLVPELASPTVLHAPVTVTAVGMPPLLRFTRVYWAAAVGLAQLRCTPGLHGWQPQWHPCRLRGSCPPLPGYRSARIRPRFSPSPNWRWWLLRLLLLSSHWKWWLLLRTLALTDVSKPRSSAASSPGSLPASRPADSG
ncbi:hypothetical protein KR032_006679 [Drosophila birchii]|nr:hypothetical protein KR032_006679 [Drosophila birchii]